MKKQLLLFAMILLPLVASANPVEIDGIYYNLMPKSGSNVAEVTSHPNYYSGDVVIPENIIYNNLEYKVISLGKYSFTQCINLKSITLPNSIETVHEDAFDYDSFNNNYTHEGIIHIHSLSSWLNIKFEGYGTPLYYAHHLYLNGEEIKELTIPDDITSIPHAAFRGCIGLTSVKIPNTVTTIGYYTFAECYNLNSVEIPNSVVEIGYGAFSHCEGLESIVIPNSVQFLGDAFSYCYNLKSVVLSNKLTKICSYTFSSCRSLTSIDIPDGVTTIEYAFAGCSSLTTIKLPQSISVITGEAFKDCISLSDVYCYMPELSTSMKSTAFNGCHIEYATLHVPSNLIPLYEFVEPWKSFGKIVAIEGDDPKQKCEKPSISYNNGKLQMACSTDGVEFVTNITDSDINEYHTSQISLTATYNISVYATKAGYDNSETATATLCWIDQQPKTEGITNGIANIPAQAVLIQSEGGSIKVQGVDEGTQVNVYSINGTQAGSAISQNGQAVVATNLQAGSVAIVKIGQKSVKVVVK